MSTVTSCNVTTNYLKIRSILILSDVEQIYNKSC